MPTPGSPPTNAQPAPAHNVTGYNLVDTGSTPPPPATNSGNIDTGTFLAIISYSNSTADVADPVRVHREDRTFAQTSRFTRGSRCTSGRGTKCFARRRVGGIGVHGESFRGELECSPLTTLRFADVRCSALVVKTYERFMRKFHVVGWK